jgi:hypothetical protein
MLVVMSPWRCWPGTGRAACVPLRDPRPHRRTGHARRDEHGQRDLRALRGRVRAQGQDCQLQWGALPFRLLCVRPVL